MGGILSIAGPLDDNMAGGRNAIWFCGDTGRNIIEGMPVSRSLHEGQRMVSGKTFADPTDGATSRSHGGTAVFYVRDRKFSHQSSHPHVLGHKKMAKNDYT